MAAIEVNDLHKVFRIPHEQHTTLTERLASFRRPVTYESLEAVAGVSLSIDQGSFVGIIGGNGSGKSTLLKIMSGLLPPDRGEVRVDGSMSALLELGLGFSPELTVRENVELYAAVLGYPRHDVYRRVREAIEFADLNRFRDAKLKNLSTGMRARLGFATALQAESDILLVDEILAVGDASFRVKCLNLFEDLRRQRKTIVMVSHDLAQVQRLCDRAVWLRDGKIAAEGKPYPVIAQYLEAMTDPESAMPAIVEDDLVRHGDGQIRMQSVWFEDDSGRQVTHLRSGGRFTVVVHFRVNQKTDEPQFGVGIKAEDGSMVYTINNNWLGLSTETVHPGQILEVRVPFLAALRDGNYELQVGIMPREMGTFYDYVECATSFAVQGSPCLMGAADLQGQMSYRIFSDANDERELDSGSPSRPGGTT